jgi:hypothetical protein
VVKHLPNECEALGSNPNMALRGEKSKKESYSSHYMFYVSKKF